VAASGGRESTLGRVNTAGPGVKRAPNPVVSRMRGTRKPCRGPGFESGRPIVRGAEAPGGNRMSKKRMPMAERQRDSRPMTAAPAVAVRNWLDTSFWWLDSKGC
jgi:hypothetical protein